jgi:hypothetical protein
MPYACFIWLYADILQTHLAFQSTGGFLKTILNHMLALPRIFALCGALCYVKIQSKSRALCAQGRVFFSKTTLCSQCAPLTHRKNAFCGCERICVCAYIYIYIAYVYIYIYMYKFICSCMYLTCAFMSRTTLHF